MEEARECWVCLEAADPDGAATVPTGCACRGSAGHAHLSCLVAAAQHNLKADADPRHLTWQECPTCKQNYTGPIRVRMARTRWGLCRGRPEGDIDRGDALEHLAISLQSEGEYAEARPLLEARLAGLRRSHGDDAEHTLHSMINLASMRVDMGKPAAALALLEEALPACRRVHGGDILCSLCMFALSRAHEELGQLAAARSTADEMMGIVRSTGAGYDAVAKIQAICNLGELLEKIGDVQAGMALQEEGLTDARRVLGEAHPLTQTMAWLTTQGHEKAAARHLLTLGTARHLPTGLRALGTFVGSNTRELNGAIAWVVGFDKGRYRVCLDGGSGAPSDVVRRAVRQCAGAPLEVKPANIGSVSGLCN